MTAESGAEPRGSGGVRAQVREFLEGAPRGPYDDPMHADDVDLRSASFLALTLTLVMLLIGRPPETHVLTPLVAVVGLAVPGLARSRWYWLLLTGLFAHSPLMRPWLALDNHHWLQLYWFVAILLTRFATRPDAALRVSARFMIGFAFTFAVGWKLLLPEFRSGAFFDTTFAADSRLGDVASAFGVQEPNAATEHGRILRSWRVPGASPEPGVVELHTLIERLTPWLAWMTIVVEATVAVAFLAPLQARLRWLRDAAMLLFVLATYPLAPVVGFGRLLLVMSAMQSELRPRVRAIVYVTAFVAVSLLGERDVVLDWMRSTLTEAG